MKTIPEKLINYSTFLNGTTYLGTADVTLPTIESLTSSVRGAGISGEIDSPTLGHYGSMTVSINWRTITKEAMQLHAPVVHQLDFRASQQSYDAAGSARSRQAVRVTIKALPKSGEIGTLDPGEGTSTTNEMEVVYLKVVVDGKTEIEIDKYNFKAVFGGQDHLAAVRADLGL